MSRTGHSPWISSCWREPRVRLFVRAARTDMHSAPNHHQSSMSRPLRIALIGTRGVPARYGGFETCVEEVGKRLVKAGHEVVVYCRAGNVVDEATTDRPDEYLGMRLVYLPAVKK